VKPPGRFVSAGRDPMLGYASRVAELMALRTRLEGSLERVERMTDSLERAAARVASGKTGGLTRLLVVREEPAMNEALASVEKLASREAELQPWLERFRRAEAQLRNALLERTAELGVYEGQMLELARLLEREQVLYRGYAIPWRDIGMLVIISILISLRLSFPRHSVGGTYWLWWVPFVIAGAATLWRLRGPKLVVTPGFIRLGEEVVRVADLKRLHITRIHEGRGRNKRVMHLFSGESANGSPRSFDLRARVVPAAFVEAVMTAGVHVSRESAD